MVSFFFIVFFTTLFFCCANASLENVGLVIKTLPARPNTKNRTVKRDTTADRRLIIFLPIRLNIKSRNCKLILYL